MASNPAAKILALVFSLFAATLLSGAAWLGFTFRSLPDVSFLSNPGVSFQITVRDWEGNEKAFTVGPENPSWTPLTVVPAYFLNAVLAGEDFSFYSHNGVDWFEVKESFLLNLEKKRFARGASTITQQLAKNLFLTREKTLARKIRELILARRLEKNLTKDRILELYVNVMELGDSVYGVGRGSRYHFGKEPAELSLRESAFLAAMLPGPKVYNPGQNMGRVMNRSDHLLSVMLKGGMIDEDQYLSALAEMPFAPEPSLTTDFYPYLPAEEEADASFQGTAMAPLPDIQNVFPEPVPVPVPIPGYGEAEGESTQETPGIPARGSSRDNTPHQPEDVF